MDLMGIWDVGIVTQHLPLRDGNWGHRAWERGFHPRSPPQSSGCVWDLLLTGLDSVLLAHFPKIPWISDSSWLDLKFLLGLGFVGGWTLWMRRDLFGGQSKVKLQHPLREKATPGIFPDLLGIFPGKSSFGISGVFPILGIIFQHQGGQRALSSLLYPVLFSRHFSLPGSYLGPTSFPQH